MPLVPFLQLVHISNTPYMMHVSYKYRYYSSAQEAYHSQGKVRGPRGAVADKQPIC